MNWKNVASLLRIDRKSGRLLRGRRLTKYRENPLLLYWIYVGAIVVGIAVGVAVGFFFSGYSVSERILLRQVSLGVFLSMPAVVLVYSLIFTFMQQIQRAGARVQVQAPYWLPITWEEHTLASTLSNFVGLPLESIALIGSAILAFSFFSGQIAFSLLTLLAMLATAFLASLFTEILGVLQTRFIGAVYKSSGRAAVWVRFVGSLLFFLIFYIVYFYITTGSGITNFVQGAASAQNTVWFIPFVWPGISLYSLVEGLLLPAVFYSALSVLFILGLFYAAVLLNRRFGLYEPPAITISRQTYLPRTSYLSRLGLSPVEAALVRKDFKAFTRRRELLFIFILPIVVMIPAIMQSLGSTSGQTSTGNSIVSLGVVFLIPTSWISLYLGSIITGEEGAAMSRIYSFPISAKNLVKSKYVFLLLLSTLVLVVTGTIGIVVYHPALKTVLVAFSESFLLALALSAISFANGIKGADFTELPRPKMVRTEWMLVNFLACAAAALAILTPIIPHAIGSITRLSPSWLIIKTPEAVAISAVISAVIAFIGIRQAIRNAKELLAAAEV